MRGQAKFRGKNKVFFNEVKDLAQYLDATYFWKYQLN